MSCIGRQINRLCLQIPGFTYEPGCRDCYGPATASLREITRLPLKNEAGHDATLAEQNYARLGPNGCEAYEERPLICRLLDTTPNLPCPEGQGSEAPVAEQVERQVHALIASTHQVLMQRPARR